MAFLVHFSWGCMLVLMSTSLGLQAQSSSKKDLAKRKKQFWKKEVRLAKSIKHDAVKATYPEIGWLSGVWCKEGEDEPRVHFQIQGARQLRKADRGFLGVSQVTVLRPETILFQESKLFDKNVVMGNTKYYDLWSYSGGKALGYGTKVWYIHMTRIFKASDTQYERYYAKSFTIRDNDFDYEAFIREKSPNISIQNSFSTPQIYLKCK